MTSSKYKDVGAIGKGPVASSSDAAYTRGMLRDMLQDKTLADGVRILTVPKDVDALMSVGFGMSKAALITESALEKMRKTDPVLRKKMRPVGAGKDALLMILASPETPGGVPADLIQIIKDMPNHSDGLDVVKMLELDGWSPIAPSDNL